MEFFSFSLILFCVGIIMFSVNKPAALIVVLLVAVIT